MKKLIFMALLLLAVNVDASTWYVVKGATGSNTGTSLANAFTSISSLTGAVGKGDTININGHFWGLTSGLPLYGGNSATDRTVWRSINTSGVYTPLDAQLSWGDTVSLSWTSMGSGIYRATLPFSNVGGVYIEDLSYPLYTQYLAHCDESGACNSGSQPDLTTPDAGEWGEDATYLYVHLRDGSSPASHTIIVSRDVTVFNFDGPTYADDGNIDFLGLDIRHMNGFIRVYECYSSGTTPDSITVQHCYMKHCSYSATGSNTAFIKFQFNGIDGFAYTPSGILIRGNTFQDCTEGNYSGHGSFVAIYDLKNSKIDSNTFTGYTSGGAALELKGNLGVSQTAQNVHVLCNIIDMTDGDGLIWTWNHQDSCIAAGNIIRTASGTAISFGYEGTACAYPYFASSNGIINNTIVDGGIVANFQDANQTGWDNFIKFNIFYNAATAMSLCDRARSDYVCSSGSQEGTSGVVKTDGHPHFYIDSNQFYRTSGTQAWSWNSNTYTTKSNWSANDSWDANSTVGNNPGFANTSSFTFAGYTPSNADAITPWSIDGLTFSQAGAVQASGPDTLRYLTTGPNPRYLYVDASGDGSVDSAVLITTMHTWTNFQDFDGTNTNQQPDSFDQSAYFGALNSYQGGPSAVEFWVWEQAAFDNEHGTDTTNYYPVPYARSGTAGANDGGNKFDLDTWYTPFFARMANFTQEATDSGIPIIVWRLGNDWSTSDKGVDAQNGFTDHPYNIDNNVNSVDGDDNSNGQCEECHTDTTLATYARYLAYYKKCYDTLKQFDNIIIHLVNESPTNGLPWQYKIADTLQGYMAAQGKVFPILISVPYPYTGTQDSLLVYGSHEVTSTNTDGFGSLASPTTHTGSKVWYADTDHMGGIAGNVEWVWYAIFAGHNPAWMDVWNDEYGIADGGGSDSVDIRNSLGWAGQNVNRMPLEDVKPMPSLSSDGLCLADTVNYSSYLVYTDDGGFTLDLSDASVPTGYDMYVDWYNYKTQAESIKRDTVDSFTSSEAFTAPSTNCVALFYTEAIAATAPVAAFSGTPTSGTAPLSVTFTDASTNTPTSWDWDWGDATMHGTTQNPTHEYSSAGTYTVTLTATNATGSDDEIKTDYITVSAPDAASDQLKIGNVKLGNVKLGGN